MTPSLRLIRTFLEAEEMAAEWMRWMGFGDAQITRAGADGGVDVVATGAIAQVKFEGLPSGRPAVQALHGVAVAEGVPGLFFSLAGWTVDAEAWAERVQLPLFRFTHDGGITPSNVAADRLFHVATTSTVLVTPDALGDGGQIGGGAHRRMTFAAPFLGVGNMTDLQLTEFAIPNETIFGGDDSLIWPGRGGIYRAPVRDTTVVQRVVQSDLFGVAAAAVGRFLYCASTGEGNTAASAVHRVDLNNNDLTWTATIPWSQIDRLLVLSSSLVVTGKVGETVETGGAWCYSRDIGRLRWATRLPWLSSGLGTAAASEDFTFIGGLDPGATEASRIRLQNVPFGHGSMLETRTGKVLWSLEDRAPLRAAISGRVLILTILEPDPLWIGHVAVDCLTGRELWRIARSVPQNTYLLTPLDAVVGDRHVWLPGSSTCCRDIFSGEALWVAGASSNILWSADRILALDLIDDANGSLVTLDPLMGDTIEAWRVPSQKGYDTMSWLNERSLALCNGLDLTLVSNVA